MVYYLHMDVGRRSSEGLVIRISPGVSKRGATRCGWQVVDPHHNIHAATKGNIMNTTINILQAHMFDTVRDAGTWMARNNNAADYKVIPWGTQRVVLLIGPGYCTPTYLA